MHEREVVLRGDLGHLVPVDPTAVVGDRDLHPLIDHPRCHPHHSGRRLSRRDPVGGALDAMVDSVHQKMTQRLSQQVDDLTVELHIVPDDLESDVLAHSPTQVAGELGKGGGGIAE